MDALRTHAAPDALLAEFVLARLDLAAATAAQRRRDTPEARRDVVECRTRIDGILDSWNAGVRSPL